MALKAFFKKHKHQIYFVSIGLLFVFVVLFVFITSLDFSTSRLAAVLANRSATSTPLSFDIEGFKKLGLVSLP